MKKFSPLNLLAAIGLAGLPLSVFAHPGHANSVWHAVLHMIEANGLWLLLALVAGIVSLGYFARRQRQSVAAAKRNANRGARS